jgi:hypothetical protein
MSSTESEIGDILLSTEAKIEVHADGTGAVALELLEPPHPLVVDVLENWPYHSVDMSHMAVILGESLMLYLDDIRAAAIAVDWLWTEVGEQGAPLDQIVKRARELEAAANRAASEVAEVLKRHEGA